MILLYKLHGHPIKFKMAMAMAMELFRKALEAMAENSCMFVVVVCFGAVFLTWLSIGLLAFLGFNDIVDIVHAFHGERLCTDRRLANSEERSYSILDCSAGRLAVVRCLHCLKAWLRDAVLGDAAHVVYKCRLDSAYERAQRWVVCKLK